MVVASKTIRVTEETNLQRLLDDAAEGPLVLEYRGERFRLSRTDVPTVEDDPWKDYDPEKVREGLRRYAGMFTPEEAERMTEAVYRGREEGTRPPDRP